MSEDIVNSIISASAGLLGALLGYAASIRASRRALDVARVQRRYERVHEMRVEVLPKLYGTLRYVLDTEAARTQRILDAVTTPQVTSSNMQEELNAAATAIAESTARVKEVGTYFQENQLWIPQRASEKAVRVIDGVTRHRDLFISNAHKVLGQIEETTPNEMRAELINNFLRNAATDELAWIHGEGTNLLSQYRGTCVEILGIEDEA